MRIKRNYFAAIKNGFGWIVSRFKPLSVHTELIYNNECWNEIKKKCEGGQIRVWHLMTPVNYNLYKSSFNTKLPKGELSRIMKKRYLWMKSRGQNLQLHIHLSLTMKNMSYAEQDKLFKDSLVWMKKELDIVPSEFVPGWWSFNEDTLKLCKKYGLKMVKERDYDYTHDYHWIL